MTFVGIVDLCSLLATLAALVFLGAGRRRALRRDARCVLVFLLLFAAFHHFSHVLDWLAGASRLDPVRDYAEVLGPVLWGLFLYVFVQDVGQRELRESEERNRMLLASLPQRIFFKMGPELRFASVNDVFARDLDLSPPEVIGKTDFDFSPRELAEKYQADDRRVMASRKPETLVEKNVTRGVERIVEVTKAPVVNDDGDVVGLFGVFTDVTERKRTEDALRESEERFRLLVGTAFDGINICEFDPATRKRRLLFCNDRYVEMSGCSRQELEKADNLDDLTTSHMTPEEINEMRRRIENGQPFKGRAAWNRPDGRENFYEFSAISLKMGDKQCHMGFDRDITARRQAEAALQYRFELERLMTAASSRFINLAHDEIDVEINRALRAMAEFAGADRSYVFQFCENGTKVDNTHEWCAEGIEPQIQDLKGISLEEELPWFAKKIRKFEVFHVPRVAGLPPAARLDREHFEGQHIQSLLVLPMVSRGSLVGFIGFDSVRMAKAWDEDTILLLRMMAEIFSNALERKRSEDALRSSEERYRQISENARDMISLHSLDDVSYLYVNPATLSTLGYSKEEIIGRPAGDLVHPDDSERVLREFTKSLAKGEGTAEFRYRKKDGTYIWVEATGRMTPDEKGRPVALIISRDITERVLRREKLRAMTLEDELTGVSNRRGFFHLADQQLKFASRTKSTLLLFFVDVDGMKWINDTLGHKEGDLALIETANVLREAFRDSDIIGRVGGDEFAILAIEAKGTKADDIVARLQKRLDARNKQAYRHYRLSLSVGIASYGPRSRVHLDELMARADALMYEQKRGKQAPQLS